ncbi:tetratricopeptide repeat protein [Maridesulfovibrio sp.]|uniref:tetratricopeptide repeat protein n=1 Tax=Maridesulfovibrio sp. TaxID=2795000 RepID=UPI0029C9FF3E|nr:tetratricopeptide repeat protein [Maridesulfovibrio sp.]
MQSKIEWYQEVLALEPSSKVFFPLARLYVEMGSLEKAVTTLRMGLDRHPDYLEARLLLVETLAKLDRESEAKAAVAPLTRLFSSYPSFWKMWGASISEGNSDVAGAMAFLFSALHGSPMSWSDVMAEGIKQLTGIASGKETDESFSADAAESEVPAGNYARPAPENSDLLVDEISQAAARVDADGESDEELTSQVAMDSLKTKTMAEVLASQGDLEGALEIYRELLCKASDDEKDELMSFMADISSRISNAPLDDVAGDDASKDPYFKHAKSKLMSTLELLADRLEARVSR